VKTRDVGLISKKTKGLFDKKTTQRGTGYAQPSDRRWMTEIRSEREHARGRVDER
jgi:hypothetical protein